MKKLSCTMLIFASGVALAASWSTWQAETSAQVRAGADRELEARVDDTVREAGTLESAESVEFRCLVPGGTTILSVVPDGSQVSKGDVLVELDSSLIEEEMQKQQITALIAEADSARALSEFEIAKIDSEVASSETKTAILQQGASSALENIQIEIHSLEKQLSLLQKKTALVKKQQSTNSAESKREAFDYQVMLLDFETESEMTKEKLEHLKSNVLPRLQQSQTQQSKLAELKLERQKLQSEANIQQAKAEYEARQVVARAERQRLEELQQQLKNCRIVAPRDGIVVHVNQSSRRAEPTVIEAGATVRERQLLLKMPDLERLQVNVHVHESKIARIRKGQSAAVSFDAFPTQVFRGKVTAVGDTALPGTWPNLDLREFEVIVSLEKPDPRLKIGLSGVAEIDVRNSK